MPKKNSGLLTRMAGPQDYPAISVLENRCFTTDAQSPRSLRYLLRHAHAVTLLASLQTQPVGYVMLLFRRNSRVARLYSIAVDQAYRGHGVAQALVEAAEQAAREQGAIEMRLEVRISNQASKRLFTRSGYRETEQLRGYYFDGDGHEDGMRMQKYLKQDPQHHG